MIILKRAVILFLLLVLLPLYAFAADMPDDQCLSDLFIPYADSIGKITFTEMKQRLDSLGVSYDQTIGRDELATFYIPCEEGSLYICFYPLGKNPVFGNPDGEFLSCLEYQRGPRWITVSDSIHQREVRYRTGDGTRDPENVDVPSVDDLLSYYRNKMQAD